mmetsp:Transcript_37912/g.84684  ORF Transcript_37912/g.84684 Transcript_37912/m.84684 type:complete len:221 (-) Transcript_37912:1895-2557(-)
MEHRSGRGRDRRGVRACERYARERRRGRGGGGRGGRGSSGGGGGESRPGGARAEHLRRRRADDRRGLRRRESGGGGRLLPELHGRGGLHMLSADRHLERLLRAGGSDRAHAVAAHRALRGGHGRRDRGAPPGLERQRCDRVVHRCGLDRLQGHARKRRLRHGGRLRRHFRHGDDGRGGERGDDPRGAPTGRHLGAGPLAVRALRRDALLRGGRGDRRREE